MLNTNVAESIASAIIDTSVFYKPTESLENLIGSVRYNKVTHNYIDRYITRPFPTGNLVIFLHLGAPVESFDYNLGNRKFHRYCVAGVFELHKVNYIHPLGNLNSLAVPLNPGAFTQFFGHPACEATNRLVELDQLIPPRFIKKIEEMRIIKEKEALQCKLEELLLSLLGCNTIQQNNSCFETFKIIHQMSGKTRVSDICKEVGVSMRTLQRFFLANVGISPREYIRIIRFQEAFRHLVKLNFNDWKEIVFELGYYDQAHFINDFRSVTGYSPNDFLKYRDHGSFFLDRYFIGYDMAELANKK